jgi:aldehyde:ferredoxin oxidoreductase
MHQVVSYQGDRKESATLKEWSGYSGQVLDVDLEKGTTGTYPLDQGLATDYVGGKGFGARILSDQLPARCSPLSPENILVFAAGPLTGTFAPASGRFQVCTKSPATGLWLDSNCGGFFGPEMKAAGVDMIIVRGASTRPVMLVVEEGVARVVDASSLWGLDTISTHRSIKETLGKGFRVACIGPAGEKKVAFASIISELRALGRGGVGAVMGAKGLKAIALRGSQGITIHDPERFMTICREAFNELAIHPDTGGGRQKYGTNVILSCMNETGVHPVRNFQKSRFSGHGEINEDRIAEYFVRNRACYSCPIYCSKIARVPSGKYQGAFTEGPEYETVWAFGAHCDNANIESIIQAEYLCDYYGMDSISAGNVIGFVMECAEKGIWTESDIGFPLRFGDDEGIIKALHLIGKRQGLGALWGEGVRKISEEIEGTAGFANHVKGLELPAYDPRLSTGMALAYATSDRGGCHLRSWPIGEELLSAKERMDPFSKEFKAEFVKNQQDLFALINSSGFCLFATFALNLKQITPILYSATGIEPFSDTNELLRIGERINNITRLFNLREGLTRAMDTLPKRLLTEPLPDGPGQGRVAYIEDLLEEYYMVRGWDGAGKPTEAKLRELGIERG